MFGWQVEDTSTSPTLSRLLSSGSNLRSSETTNGVDNLCQEMNHLMHDYDVITRIASLINTLHGQYDVSSALKRCSWPPIPPRPASFNSSARVPLVSGAGDHSSGAVSDSTEAAAQGRGDGLDRCLLPPADRPQSVRQGGQVHFSDGFSQHAQRLDHRY